MLDFLSIQLLLIDSNNYSHLGAAVFKLRPLKSVTDRLSRDFVAPCFRASQQFKGAKRIFHQLLPFYFFVTY